MHPRSELRRDVQSRGRHRGSFCPAHSAPPPQGLEQGAGVCVWGVSNRRVSPCLLRAPAWPWGAAGRGLLAGHRHLGHGGPHRLPGDRGRQPPAHHGRLHPPGHGGPAFPARLPGLLRGRPGEQVSAAVREYPMGALGRGWMEPCTRTKGDSHWGLSQVGWPPGAGEPPTLAICIHAGPVPAAWVSRPQARGGLGLQVRTARLPHRRVS